MSAAKFSAGLLAVGGLLGYLGAFWQTKTLLIAAGITLLAGIIVSGFTDRASFADEDHRCK
ncbi:hypothetical protein [Yersinia aleksiciae]|uniref:Membrane protein n=1 Tax=Yersinia aleksiciae TaxID=263819 RepID=A0ABN4HE91_YERAE|nr:hypothetical protein [Yersinia aleksiciae]AKP35087.1 membrane protein [Yersinia aleksiciae]MDA5496677.1 hypothetical protein [Yersinia aleksiciae]NIK97566.1 hypothetical protein [Yersinia aleksiciae]WQC69335.1 hypothetical protein N0K21_11490 [Yersinia aleksiciae]CFQ43062.1 membrane protein [Yersinia aleksiciae]